MSLADEITLRLQCLEPSSISLTDESALHAGHQGNGGGAHFKLKITSSHFSEKSQIIRHRIIYQTLNDLMPHKLHAISIQAIAPNEA